MFLIDILINNDRNEDNWSVIKFKKENFYKLAPIYDCGNYFYVKTLDDRIKTILGSEEKLYSNATNGTTAYKDDNSTRLLINKTLKLDNNDLYMARKKIVNNIKDHFDKIKSFIYSI